MKNLFFSASLIFLVLICQAFKNPIATPTMILAEANTARAENVQSVSETQSAKPEFVINISESFQTSFLDLDEEYLNYMNQFLAISRYDDDVFDSPDGFRYFVVPVKFLIEQEKNLINLSRISEEIYSRQPLMQEALRYREQHGRIDRVKMPKWLFERTQLISKKLIFKLMSMLDKYDYGLDVDYLSIPTIDNGKLQIKEDQKRTKRLYSSLFVLQETYKYNQLLNEYSGVATRGRIGRELGIDGVELYNLWRGLDKKGLVSEHEMAHMNAEGNESTKKVKMWLEIPAGINVRQLVNSLDVSQNIKNKLESYLLSLQRGKRRDNNFIRRYEELRQGYRERVVNVYILYSRESFLSNVVSPRPQEDINRFNAQVNEWVREYRGFEISLFGDLRRVFNRNPDGTAFFFDRTVELLERRQESFNGNIPLGQEFLFQILEKIDSDKNLSERSFYNIKFK